MSGKEKSEEVAIEEQKPESSTLMRKIAEPERRYVDDRWLCFEGNIFQEYIDDQWKATNPDQYEELLAKWEASASTSTNSQSTSKETPRCVHNGKNMIWNELSKQWLEDVDVNEDFLAEYNANYGVTYDYNSMPLPEIPVKEAPPPKLTKEERRAQKREYEKAQAIRNAGWVDIEDDKNTNVYVDGLPPDITDEQFEELMGKCGVIMKDPRSKKLKTKIYRNEKGEAKGDATCCYVKMESVRMALEILDGWTYEGNKIHVEKAKFELKGQFDPSKKKKRLTADQKKKFFDNQQKIFSWKPELERDHY